MRRSRRDPEAVLALAAERLVATVDELVAALVTATAAHVQQELTAALATIPGTPLPAPRAAGRRSRLGRPGNAAPLAALEPDQARLRAVLHDVIEEKRLPTREAQILIASVHGMPRDRLAGALGVGENTVKTQVKQLLRRLQMGPTLNDAVWAVRCRLDAA